MQWIPISRELLRAIPNNRPCTKLEAAAMLTADLQDGVQRSMREYGRVFQWDHKTVKSFFESGVIVNLRNSPPETNNNSMLQDNIPQMLALISNSPNTPQLLPKCSPANDNNNMELQGMIPQSLPNHSPNAPQLFSRERKREDICPSSPSKTLFDLWNKTAEGTPLSKVRELSSSRQKKCTVRLKERGLDDWAAIFRRIADTPFLCGQNERGWKADFDWIIASDGNAGKVLEGKYDRAGGSSKPSDNRYSDIFAGA